MAEDTNKELLIRFEGTLNLFNQKVEALAETMEVKVEQLTKSIDNFSKALTNIEDKKLADHDRRISAIEQWQAKILGAYIAVGIVSAIIGALVSYVLKFVVK